MKIKYKIFRCKGCWLVDSGMDFIFGKPRVSFKCHYCGYKNKELDLLGEFDQWNEKERSIFRGLQLDHNR